MLQIHRFFGGPAVSAEGQTEDCTKEISLEVISSVWVEVRNISKAECLAIYHRNIFTNIIHTIHHPQFRNV